jgi:plastocyanin
MARHSSGISRRGFLRGVAGGAALAGASGVGTAQEATTHTVDMTDQLVFDPDAITIAPGDTIVWENVGSIGHSVTAYEEEIPEEAEYFATGGFDDEQTARSAYEAGDPDSGDVGGGGSFEHTFEIEGTYGYFCIPHENVGMVASVDVVPGGGDTGPIEPAVPGSFRDLTVAVTGAAVAVLSLAYVFLKYGGEYGPTEEE